MSTCLEVVLTLMVDSGFLSTINNLTGQQPIVLVSRDPQEGHDRVPEYPTFAEIWAGGSTGGSRNLAIVMRRDLATAFRC